MLHKSSLGKFSRCSVTKQSEVCHWIVSALLEALRVAFFTFSSSSPVDQGPDHTAEFTRLSSVALLMQTCLNQLHVHEPDELTFVEQTPRTAGGPEDLTQTAVPT